MSALLTKSHLSVITQEERGSLDPAHLPGQRLPSPALALTSTYTLLIYPLPGHRAPTWPQPLAQAASTQTFPPIWPLTRSSSAHNWSLHPPGPVPKTMAARGSKGELRHRLLAGPQPSSPSSAFRRPDHRIRYIYAGSRADWCSALRISEVCMSSTYNKGFSKVWLSTYL